MPDVTRSDSQRSDKPRVSFNRDVHVKRIGREGVVSALAGDGEGHLIPLAVRRERPGRLSRRELEKEAEAILRQAERVQCTPASTPAIILGVDKYSTLPPRPKPRHSGHPAASSIFNSLDRRNKKKPPVGSDSTKLKRRFSNPDNSWRAQPRHERSSPERSSPEAPQRRRLSRSVSDAGRPEEKKDKERSSIFGTLDRIRNKKKKKPPVLPPREDILPPVRKKKQLSPIIEMSPKVEGDPFKFAPTEAVVYAEVVARPNGKTTVHTTVPVDPSTVPDPESEEDEGVDMGHRGGTESRRFSYDTNMRSTSPKEYTVDIKREQDLAPKRRDDDIRQDKIINMLRSRSNPLLDEDVVGGYRREVRTERVIRVEGGEEPDGRGRADGMDFNSKRRSSKDFFEEETPLKSTYYGEVGKIHSYDDLDRIRYNEPIRAWTPPLETSLIDSNNLSYRRDRLESRLTNHKRRFLGTAHESKSYRDDNTKNADLRKDFLTSQLNKDDKERGYFEKKIATEIEHRQHMLKNKDVFADSGIEMSDYRKDSARDVATLNRRNAAETTRIIRTETSRTKSTPTLNKSDYQSDGEQRYKGDISMKFVEEERRRRDVVPASSTLVKNYAKPAKDELKTTKKEEKITKEKKKDKLTRMDKVKQLMFGSKDGKKNKKNKNQEEEEEDLLRKRYTEYKGSDVSVNSSPVIHRRRQTSSSEVDDRTDQEQEYYGSRQRLATPSPRPAEEDTWFKSLTRRNKHSKPTKKHKAVNGEDDSLRSQNKHLRFFGDSDRESLKSGRVASPSSRLRDSSPNTHLLQVPPHHQGRRHITVDSSAESTTEGDSSQQSQKSVVYLHAATVGDIPGSRKLHRSVLGGGRRSMSREELSSRPPSEVITPQSRTLSRSISVLAPWRPKHNRQEVVYDGGGKPPKAPKLRSRPHLADHKEKNSEKSKKSSSRELRKSKENLLGYKGDSRRGSSESILTDHKRSRGNLVFVGKRENYDEVDNRRHENGSALDRSHHTIDRSHNKEKNKSRDLSRSISIPKDSRVSSGWFKGSKAK